MSSPADKFPEKRLLEFILEFVTLSVVLPEFTSDSKAVYSFKIAFAVVTVLLPCKPGAAVEEVLLLKYKKVVIPTQKATAKE